LPSFKLGFFLGDLILMTIAVSWTAYFTPTFVTAFTIVCLAGACYLPLMALKICLAPLSSIEFTPDAVRQRL
jgi:threonine/homoserine/homoserine lactone efflux protein